MLRVQGYGHTAEASSGLYKITDLSSRMLEKEVALSLPFMVLLDLADLSVISLMLECMLCVPYSTC